MTRMTGPDCVVMCNLINTYIHTYIHTYTRFSLSMEMSRLTRDGTAEPVSRDQILRHARGQGNIHFPCSADHEQDWQPYPVDPYSAICDDHTYIHTYIHQCEWHRMTRMTGPDCVVMCNLINTYIHTYSIIDPPSGGSMRVA